MKSRGWTIELYEDSANKDWRKILEETRLQYCYICHDRDKKEDGKPKEKHYHIMYIYDGPQTEKVAKELAHKLGAKNDYVEKVNSIKGMVDYFIHKNNPEKAQYSIMERISGNGFNPNDITYLTANELLEYKKQLQKMIIDNEIKEYSDLMDLVIEMEDKIYYMVASGNTMFFDKYITSKRFKYKNILEEENAKYELTLK